MLWTWFVAKANHIELPATAVLAMGVAVWMLYAADRLLDTRSLDARSPSDSGQYELEHRHYFHRHHQKAFRLAIFGASILLALLLPDIAFPSIRLYLVLAALVFGYFVLIHVVFEVPLAKRHRLPKEFAVGVFFSAATFIPTVARAPYLRLALLPGAVLFAALCSLNCLFIYAWEHPTIATAGSNRLSLTEAHPATKLALRFLPALAAVTALTSLVLTLSDRSLPWPLSTACGAACLFLMLLHRNHHRLSPTTLRATADLCLLTPLLLLYF